MDNKWYKVINADNRGIYSNFDFSKYLPTKNKCGKWLPIVDDLCMCKSGYHITRFWNMWYNEGCQIFEVEPKGIINEETSGVIEKHLCCSFRFVRKLFFDKKNNTGNCNTGNRNTGDWNTGDRNTGDRNTGDWNTGDRNTGYMNTGDLNTGNWNTGDRNTGNWNTGDRNTGFFNTTKPKIRIFNKETNMKCKDIEFPDFFYFNEIFENDKNLHKTWKKAFKTASNKDIQLLIRLPNFNYKIFEEITGISKKMIDKRRKED